MSRFGFIGGAYQAQAYSADQQSCINLLPERVESGAGKNDVCLIGAPGHELAYQLSDQPLRGMLTVSTPGVASRSFAVAGSTLFELFADGTFSNRGAVENDGKPASLTNSNIQLMIAAGGKGYCFTLATNVLSAPIATIAGVIQVIFCDTFFAALIANSAQWFISPPEDGINWDPADTTAISVFADNVVSMAVLQRQPCFLGKKKSVCYYDSGGTFSFDVVPGGTSEQGSAATFGVTPADNTLFGIWADEHGQGVAFRAQGYTFQRISTHAIEKAWQSYPTIADAQAFSYQIRGHTIVEWYFPSAANGDGRSWGFDVSTGLWFELAYFDNGKQKAHRACCHMFAFGKHLVGDPLSGNIYDMEFPIADGAGGWRFCTDAGNIRKWLRRSPYVGMAGVYNFFSQLEFLMDVGLGPETPLTSDGQPPAGDGSNWRDPQAMLRYSNDGGHTWSNERTLNLGQIGKFGTRVIARRLGKVWGSIGRIFELSGSDPVPIRITDADLTADPQMQPQKRLTAELRERA